MFPVRLNLFNFKDGHLKIKKKGENQETKKKKNQYDSKFSTFILVLSICNLVSAENILIVKCYIHTKK